MRSPRSRPTSASTRTVPSRPRRRSSADGTCMNKIFSKLAVLAIVAIAGCNTLPSGPDPDKLAEDMVKTGFRSEGIAKIERVTAIDETLKLCSAADVAGKPLDAAVARRIEAENLKTIRWPSDGRFLGDWKQG